MEMSSMGPIERSFEPDEPGEEILLEQFTALLPLKARGRAKRALKAGGADRAKLLESTIETERARRRRRSKHARAAGAASVCAAVGAAFWRRWTLEASSPVILAAVAAAVCAARLVSRPTRLERRAQRITFACSDPWCIGGLLEGLQSKDPDIRNEVRENLIRALPEMTAAMFSNLSQEQRRRLYDTLDYDRRDTFLDLRLAVLRAIETAGDITSLGVVYRLAAGDAMSDAAVKARDAARICAERLFERLPTRPLEELSRIVADMAEQLWIPKVQCGAYAPTLHSLTRLLPQLSRTNYKRLLSPKQRQRLYGLLLLSASSPSETVRYGKAALQMKILDAIREVDDPLAVEALNSFLRTRDGSSDETIHITVRRLLAHFEARADENKGAS